MQDCSISSACTKPSNSPMAFCNAVGCISVSNLSALCMLASLSTKPSHQGNINNNSNFVTNFKAKLVFDLLHSNFIGVHAVKNSLTLVRFHTDFKQIRYQSASGRTLKISRFLCFGDPALGLITRC